MRVKTFNHIHLARIFLIGLALVGIYTALVRRTARQDEACSVPISSHHGYIVSPAVA